MRKNAVYRVRVPKSMLASIKRVAAAKNEDASAWGRAIIEAELQRDLAALELREQLLTAKQGEIAEHAAMDLVNEVKRAVSTR